MFGYTKINKQVVSAGPDVALRQGWNEKEKKFWIQLTDKKTGITIRKYMDEEYYQNFHNMGRYTYRQTKKDEGEFDDEDKPREFNREKWPHEEWKNIP